MVDSGASVDGACILTPGDAQRLVQACPDLHEWPRIWHVQPADIPVGEQIVQLLTPFLLHLLNQGLAKSTVRRHRDSLWLLGGELVRQRCDDDALARLHVKDALEQLIDVEGGPLIHPRISDAEQESLDATCRKLHRFLHGPAAANSPACLACPLARSP